jgi:arginyl-tRNA synthetase
MRRNKMSYLKTIEQDIIKAINNIGYEVDKIDLTVSNRPDLGDYQINDAMKLAKAYHKNPREIAESIKTELEKDYRFENINIAGPGFINITISNKALVEFLNHEIELVSKKRNGQTKTQKENEKLVEVVFEAIANAGHPVTVTELFKAVESDEIKSAQKLSALVKKLKDADRVVRTEDKKVAYFSIAE